MKLASGLFWAELVRLGSQNYFQHVPQFCFAKLIGFPAIGILAVVVHAFGQGTLVFDNRLGDTIDAAAIICAPNCDRRPTGTNYVAQLFAGPAGTAETKLLSVSPPVPFRKGAAAGFVDPGTNRVVPIPGVRPGEIAVAQIRAWSAQGGTTYLGALEAANFNREIFVGMSTVLIVRAGSMSVPGDLSGLRSFYLMPMPLALQTQRTVDGLELSWPGYATNYVLQTSTSIEAASWAEVLGPHALRNGRFALTNKVFVSSQFFRLRQK